jgi:hypothetical protein
MEHNLMIDAIGWVGAGLLLIAYGAVSSGRLGAKSRSYQVLNMIGSIFLIVNTAYYQAFPSTFVNLIWIAIAVMSLFSIQRAKRRPV